MPSESFSYRPDLRHATLGLMSMKTSIPYSFRHKLRVQPLPSLLSGAPFLEGYAQLAPCRQRLASGRNNALLNVEKAAQTSSFPALCSSLTAG